MIRPFQESDMPDVLDIWLNASLISHDFISDEFWKAKVEDMKNIYLPASETYIFEEEGKVLGFISLYGNSLAAIFVNPKSQGKGIGQELIKEAKTRRDELHLSVYAKNTNSVRFYLNCGFQEVNENIDTHTGEKEILMKWIKAT